MNSTPNAIAYPNEGGVRIKKQASDANFRDTGLTRVELSAAGMSQSCGTDLLFVLDLSNSMAWSAENGAMAAEADKLPTETQTTKLYDAITVMQELSETLLTSDTAYGNSVSLVTFAGYDKEHNSEQSAYLDSVQTAFVYETDYSKIKTALDLTRVTGYAYTSSSGQELVRYDAQIGTIQNGVVSHVKGQNRDGSNYDYGFWQASKAVDSIKAAYYAQTGNKTQYDQSGRELIVVFLTDGLPSTYNGVTALSSSGASTSGYAGNGDYVAGTTKLSTAYVNTATSCPSGMSYNDVWLKHVADVPANTQAAALYQKIQAMQVIGIDLENSKMPYMSAEASTISGWENTLLSKMVSGATLTPMEPELDAEWKAIQEAALYRGSEAARHALVTDQIGAAYDLQTASKTGLSTPKIVVTRYDVWTDGQTSDSKLLGTRNGSGTVLETITFNTAGTAAYSSVIDERNGTKTNIMVQYGGKTYIRGEYVSYEKDNSTSAETFTWNIDTIDDEEYTLSYDLYLIGAQEGSTAHGVYPTNGSASISYLDCNDQSTTKAYTSPELVWGRAATKAEYYLVNRFGLPVTMDGASVSFENREIVGYGASNSYEYFTEFTHSGAGELPEGYIMFNPQASYTVYAEADGTGRLEISDTATVVTTKRTDTDQSDYAQTQVSYGVLLAVSRTELLLVSDTVVLDYGKPVSIDVTKNETHRGYRYEAAGLLHYDSAVDLSVKQVGSGSASLEGAYGSFRMENGTVVYTPGKLLEGVEEVFAVVKVAAEANPEDVCYLYQKLTVLPATNVYYETDFAEGVFVYETDDWQMTSPEDGDPSTERQDDGSISESDYGIQPDNAADYLFFGFDNAEADRTRYASDLYGGRNFDQNSSDWYFYKRKVESLSLNNEAGTMTITQLGRLPQIGDTPTTNDDDVYPDVYFDTTSGAYNTFPLNYDPSNAEIYQVRFKMENFKLGDYTKTDGVTYTAPEAYFFFQYWAGSHQEDWPLGGVNTTRIAEEHLDSGCYVTITGELKGDAAQTFRNRSNITKLRMFFGGIESIAEDQPGKLTVDYIYIGPGDMAPKPVYGYDSSYADDGKLSDHSSVYVEGRGIKTSWNTDPSKYTHGSFHFTGTGFDIFSRTGSEQGSIRVTIYTDKAMDDAHRLRTISVNCKGDLELYQIPVVSVQGLDYGTYYVTIGVQPKVEYQKPTQEEIANGALDFTGLNHGNQFYFDAVRIYDPICTRITENHASLTATESLALQIYSKHHEAYAYIKEVRDTMLEAQEFNELTDAVAGSLFVDTSAVGEVGDSIHVTGNIAANVATYDKIGPKNEVYLGPGQAVAFKLQIASTQKPVSIDIGAKSILGDTTTLVAGFVGTVGTQSETLAVLTKQTYNIATGTALYYELDTTTMPASGPVYLVLQNPTKSTDKNEKVLSITDLKVAYGAEPAEELPWDDNSAPGYTETHKRSAQISEEVSFLVDENTLQAAVVFMKAVLETPVLDSEARILHSLNLASDISLNYVVAKEHLADYEKFYLECAFDGSSIRLEATEKGDYYYFTLDGLAATQMSDVIDATLYMSKEGRNYYSETDSYSIASYAYAQLDKANAADSLKTLCADLLRYGSKAQSYKNYRTDHLADAAMTEEHKAYLSDLSAVSFGSNNAEQTDCSVPAVTWIGKTLLLDSRVTVRFVVNTASYTGEISDLSLKICYTDLDGEEQAAVLTEAVAYSGMSNAYAFDFSGLQAAELRCVLSAAVYAGDTQLSNSLVYSADTYGNNKTGTLGDLCKALFAYSDSAKQYFMGG